jgi:uncharacterized protein (TIGR03083 family)
VVTFDPTPAEIAEPYSRSRGRVSELVSSLRADQLEVPVPATPRWTARELLCHVVGCPVALVAGEFEGAGSEPWTQAQVDARRDRGADELLAEWEAAGPAIDAAIRGGTVPVPVTLDIITHEQDLRAAVGAERTPDADALRFLVDGFGARVDAVVGKAALPPLQLRAGDTGWYAGVEGGVVATATEYEWARALAGRRSVRQVAAFDWSDDSAPYLDLLSPFGPLRETDVTD